MTRADPTSSTDRALPIGGLVNLRDMGGVRLDGGTVVVGGALLRGEWPGWATEEVWEPLRAHGVRTVIDLRSAGEPGYEIPAEYSVRLVRSPLFEFDLETLLEQWSGELDVGTFYAHVLEECGDAIALAARAIADAPPGGVYVHCNMGKDRTGILVALVLEALGADREELAVDFGLSADNLAERLRDWAGEGLSETNRRMRRKLIHSREEHLREVLVRVEERHGGSREYLLAHGLEEDDLERLRRRLATAAPAEDLVHEPRQDDRKWRESYYWDLCDPEAELMLYATFGKRPARGRSGFLIALWDTSAGELLAAQDIDVFERHDDHHRIAGLGCECVEPFRRWRLWFDGELVRCPRIGRNRFAEPRRIAAADRETVPVRFELEFECVGEPRVYQPAEGWSATFDGHHEQATLATGRIEVAGRDRRVEALPGIRDHSWGTRDWHGVTESRWVAAALQGETDISLMRQQRADGTVALDGALYREGGIEAIVSYEEEVSYEESVDPPEARAITMRLGAERGAGLELKGEVRAMLPIVFADPTSAGTVTWNDRAFVAFAGDGRKGFGTVEFQRLLEGVELD